MICDGNVCDFVLQLVYIDKYYLAKEKSQKEKQQ